MIWVALLSILGAMGIYVAREWQIVQQRKHLLRDENYKDLPGPGMIGLGDVTIPSNSWIRRLMKDGGAPDHLQFQPDPGQTDEAMERWRVAVGRWRRAFPETKITFFAPNDPDSEARWRDAFPGMDINVIMPRDRDWRGKDGREIPKPKRLDGEEAKARTKWDGTIAATEAAIERDPKDAGAHAMLARVLAMISEVRNVERAIELATKACELTEWKKASYLENLAVVHGEAGDFAAAVKWMEKAVVLEPENKAYQSRLDCYKAGKPLREHPHVEPEEQVTPAAE